MIPKATRLCTICDEVYLHPHYDTRCPTCGLRIDQQDNQQLAKVCKELRQAIIDAVNGKNKIDITL